MIEQVRKNFNDAFTKEKYSKLLNELDAPHPGAIEFRIAETPVFIPRKFKDMIIEACEGIVDTILDPKFNKFTEDAIPAQLRAPNENNHSHFIAFDFGICKNEDGEYEPQLIEMQGFPSLFAYQAMLDEEYRNNFSIPEGFTSYLGNYTKESYVEELKEIIIGDAPVDEVVLLELFPHKQKTRIDFYATADKLGIPVVCLTEISREGRKLFYKKDGTLKPIRRIYNRVIFDELEQQSAEVIEMGKIFFEDLDVEWIPHPNWFYRISKYTMPFLRNPFVPKTYFLNEIHQPPTDLENYVLKPLFSFAGQGVLIDVTMEEIEKVKDPVNWILQQKVSYADVIATPDGPAKCEIRIFYFWKDGEPRPKPAMNLARLSKGKMIGVRYNKDKEWVGGSIAYFER